MKALLVGAAGCAALYAVMKAITVFELPAGRYGKLGIGVAIFALAGFLTGGFVARERHPREWRLAATAFGAALLGIAGGVVFWNWLEDLVFSRFGEYPIYQQRTLFPFDIALLWMFGSVPLMTGIVAGVVRRTPGASQ